MWSIATASERLADFAGESTGDEVAAEAGYRLDEAGFERLHARTSQALWSYLRRLTGDPAAADDVHQESYLRYLARPCPSSEERRQSAYLFRIATNLVHDRWRREKRERGWLEQLLAPATAARPGRRQELSVDFETVFGRLKPRQRALLWLAYVEGYRHREIARILKLKEASVKVLLSRARRRLAGLLRDSGLAPETTLAAAPRPRIKDEVKT